MVTTNAVGVKSFLRLYNWRWLVAYYRMLALGATYEAAYDQADYEAGQPVENSLWNGDYSDVLPAEQRGVWVGE